MESSKTQIMSINEIVDYFTAEPADFVQGKKIDVLSINIVFFPEKALTYTSKEYTTYYFYPYAVSLYVDADGKKQYVKLDMEGLKDDLGDWAVKVRKRSFIDLKTATKANVLKIRTEEQKYKNHTYYKYNINPLLFPNGSEKYEQMMKDFEQAKKFQFDIVDGDTLL